jgi:hypothetical protein
VFRLRLVLLIALVALLAACGGSAPSSAASRSPEASPQVTEAPLTTEEPVGSEDPATSEDPGATDEPAPTDEPVATDEPVQSEDPVASDLPSAEPGEGAAACSGNASNREWFQRIARAVDWPVLCGVLPKGWFVGAGTYRLASGGKLVISYKGPGGASIVLSEGAYCLSDATACTPAGSEVGEAALGPLGGTLYETTDGYAIVVSPGENPGWLMTTKGITREATVSLGADLAQVGR